MGPRGAHCGDSCRALRPFEWAGACARGDMCRRGHAVCARGARAVRERAQGLPGLQDLRENIAMWKCVVELRRSGARRKPCHGLILSMPLARQLTSVCRVLAPLELTPVQPSSTALRVTGAAFPLPRFCSCSRAASGRSAWTASWRSSRRRPAAASPTPSATTSACGLALRGAAGRREWALGQMMAGLPPPFAFPCHVVRRCCEMGNRCPRHPKW